MKTKELYMIVVLKKINFVIIALFPFILQLVYIFYYDFLK